jgi:uncharacterized protein (DUF362 family)
MHKCSRREFVVRSAGAAGMMALATKPLLARAAAAAKPAEMTIARWAGPKKLDARQFQNAAVKLTEKAIEGLGGMGRFVRRGDVVWVKPNIAWEGAPEYACNTNPDVVATLIRLCFEAGAKTVRVGDYPCQVAKKTYATSGIAAAGKAAGAEVVFLDPSRFREMSIRGERVKTLPVCAEIVESDLVINVPLPKHHSIAKATVCMKNYMGVIDKRRTFHQAMAECLADLTRFMKPRLCVVDGMRVLVANGPRGGRLQDVRMRTTVAAGTDIVAMDAFGVELLDMRPASITSIVKGHEAGLGKMDYRALEPREFQVA